MLRPQTANQHHITPRDDQLNSRYERSDRPQMAQFNPELALNDQSPSKVGLNRKLKIGTKAKSKSVFVNVMIFNNIGSN